MYKSAGRVPWLNLLPEEELDFCRVLLGNVGQYRVVNSFEHFGGEGTDVVKVELNGVNGFWRNIDGVGLASELGRECHPDSKLHEW